MATQLSNVYSICWVLRSFFPLRKLNRLVFLAIFHLKLDLGQWKVSGSVQKWFSWFRLFNFTCNYFQSYPCNHSRLTNVFYYKGNATSSHLHVTLFLGVYTSHRWHNSTWLISLPQATLWRPLGLPAICSNLSKSCLQSNFPCGPWNKWYKRRVIFLMFPTSPNGIQCPCLLTAVEANSDWVMQRWIAMCNALSNVQQKLKMSYHFNWHVISNGYWN